VSVFGTNTIILTLEVFPGTLLNFVLPKNGIPVASWIIVKRIFLFDTLNAPTLIQLNAKSTKIRLSIEYYHSAGILTGYPSTTPFGLALGSTNPGMNAIAQETLDLRCLEFSSRLWLLMPTFSLLYTPRWLTPSASAHRERSPTKPRTARKLEIRSTKFETNPDDKNSNFRKHRFEFEISDF